MRLRALASDYDDTLATDGALEASTVAALEELRGAGFRVLLVTGRVLSDLRLACPRLDLFDRVVAENGATLYRPGATQRPGILAPLTEADDRETLLAEPLPPHALEALRERGVPLFLGRVIVATYVANEPVVREVFRELGLAVSLVRNRSSLMLLPCLPGAAPGADAGPGAAAGAGLVPVDKRSGFLAALDELSLSAGEVAGVGDAQNDLPFVTACGLGVAVANALPELKLRAQLVTQAPRGAGVEELIARLLAQ